MKLYLLCAAAVAAVASVFFSNPSAKFVDAYNVYVIDGDTITVDGERVRLMGFDTPEIRSFKCPAEKQLGDQAKARVRSLIDMNGGLTLQYASKNDKYGRRLAQAFVSDWPIGDLLIQEGLARAYNGGKRQSWCAP
jgi:endonuclease YncB( thermonuclease family)